MASAFENSTLYNATVSTGQSILFTSKKIRISVAAEDGGVFWVRPRLVGAAAWTPASPIPAANSVATGWARVVDGSPATWGHEDLKSIVGPVRTYPIFPDDYIAGFDIWCETTGSLAIIAWG